MAGEFHPPAPPSALRDTPTAALVVNGYLAPSTLPPQTTAKWGMSMQTIVAHTFCCLWLQTERSPLLLLKTGEGMEAGKNGFTDQGGSSQGLCAREGSSPSSSSF